MPLLAVQNLHKDFSVGTRHVAAVQGVSFELEAGQSIGIMGVSGAGKSTLLHMIGGLETPSSGEAYVRERALYAATSPEQLEQYRQRDIGFVFQFHYLIAELSALENAMLPLRIQRVPVAQARARAQAMLERVGIGHRAEHRPAQMSGGEQQRAALARALVHEPAILLADEPTGNLDASTGEEIGELLISLSREKSMALVVVTHNDVLAARMDRVIEMRGGALAARA